MKATYAFLLYGVAAALHKSILASFVGHLAQQSIERDGVWGGLTGGVGDVLNIVAHRGAEAALKPHLSEHIK